MAPKAKGGKKRPRRDTNREAAARKAGQDGVAPQLSKRKDSLFIQTALGRLLLESKGRLTKLGEKFFQGKGISWRARTSSESLDGLEPRWTKDGLRQFVILPNGKKVLLLDWDPIGLEPICLERLAERARPSGPS